MSEEKIDNFVDLLFNFDMQELENETKFLENYKKLQQENKQLKEVIEEVWDFIKKYPGISQSGVMTIKEILDKGVKDE